MKVYIASSFSLIPKVSIISKALENSGHKITMKWWDRAFNIPSEGLVHTTELKKKYATLSPEDFYKRPECKIVHDTDKRGVFEAEVLLFVADSNITVYNGANVELCMADAWGKPRICIGELANSALYYGMTFCSTVEEVLLHLSKLEEASK